MSTKRVSKSVSKKTSEKLYTISDVESMIASGIAKYATMSEPKVVQPTSRKTCILRNCAEFVSYSSGENAKYCPMHSAVNTFLGAVFSARRAGVDSRNSTVWDGFIAIVGKETWDAMTKHYDAWQAYKSEHAMRGK